MLPVAVAFLSLGGQIACASVADLDSSRATPLFVGAQHDHASTAAQQPLGLAADTQRAGGNDCLQPGVDCNDCAAGDSCVIAITDDALIAATSSITKTDDLTKVAVMPMAGLDGFIDRVEADDHAWDTPTPRHSPGARYLRFCTFRE